MATSRGASASGNGIFSSLTSLFGSTSLNGDEQNGTSSSAYANTRPGAPRKGSSIFGSGLRRGTSRDTQHDDAAWSLPYSNSNRGAVANADSPRSSTAMNGSNRDGSLYANAPGLNTPSYASFMGSPGLPSTPNESSSTLVPGQSRPSMSFSTKVAIPSGAFPPLKHTWRRIRAWCDQNYTEMSDTLNWAATEAQIEDLELEIGYSLPPAVRDSYLCYDGQELESHQSCSDGLFFGLPLMSLEQVAEEWRFWRGVDEDPTSGANAEVRGWMNSCPAGWVRHEYSHRGWIPLITDRVGNYVGVDLSPLPEGGGAPGQVILFGRDFDTKIVLWRGEGEGGWGRFLQSFAEELESGETWTLESEVSSDSNDEEDAIGYESYFSGTGGGHGGGDRGGDGAVSFKLRGEYKGWPVLEAWADRSMRSWEEIGMPVGQPTWRVDPPRVVLPDEVDSEDYYGNQSREQIDERGEGSGGHTNYASFHEQEDMDASLAEGPSSARAHPLETTADSSISSEADARSRNSLSPPPSRSFGSRQRAKQRDENWSVDSSMQPLQKSRIHQRQPQQQQRQRKSAPVPAAPLDLPTIDDVRAAHAAALASQRRSGNYHYDVDRAARPPAGSGGMGMGMGMGSGTLPSYVPRHASGLVPSSTARRSGSSSMAAEGRPHLRIPEEDGVELENRVSAEMLSPLNAEISSEDMALSHRSSNDVVVDMAPHGASSALMQSPSANGAPRTPTNASRTLYAAGSATPSTATLPLSGSNGTHGTSSTQSASSIGTLIDANERPDGALKHADIDHGHVQRMQSALADTL